MENITTKKNDIKNSVRKYRELINVHVKELQKDEMRNQKKILELCHIGKLLLNVESDSSIERVCEIPDFFINVSGKTVGVEHQIIIDSKEKSYEGFYQNIFQHAENELKKDVTTPNFLANCRLHDNLNFKLKQKKELITLTIELIKGYWKTKKLQENQLIERISMMPHSEINLYPNFGAWWQKELSSEILQNAINKKEKLLTQYRKTEYEIWLLLVIGGTNASSYEVNDQEEYTINTNFDKVFLLEDHKNQLYQLK